MADLAGAIINGKENIAIATYNHLDIFAIIPLESINTKVIYNFRINVRITVIKDIWVDIFPENQVTCQGKD